MTRILVTGSSGTIGTRLCERLLQTYKGETDEIIGLDRNINPFNKSVNDITKIADLLKPETYARYSLDFENADILIHLAANARVYDLVKEPELARDNMLTVFNALELARKLKIPIFIFASSRETYGNTEDAIHSEEDVRIERCESPYTASKMAGEALVHSYAKCYGIKSVILRFSNVYGMYDRSDRFVPLMIGLARKNKPMNIFGRDKLLDFTYIYDTVNGIMLCVEGIMSTDRRRCDAIAGNTFNIATGDASRLIDVAEMIKTKLESSSPIVIKDNRPGEVVKCRIDISKARELLGYKPQVGIEEGIKKSVEWYSRNC